MNDETRKVAQNAVAIMETLYASGWTDPPGRPVRAVDAIYESEKDRVGGFPGVQMLYVTAAEIFSEAEPDDGETYDWPAAIDLYACDLVAYVKCHGYWPGQDKQRELAHRAIEAYQ